MTRFIKIFTIMTGLTLMTACGASGVLDDVRDLLAEARAALTKEATESARNQFLDERIIDNMLAEEIANGLALEEQAEARLRITRQVAAFSDIKRESETAKVQDELDNLSPEELAEFNATVQKRLQFLGQVAGGTEETRTTYINECGVEGNTACIDVVSDACAVAAEVGSERCVSFTARVCDANPLYDACDDNDDYFLARDDVCWIQGRNGGTRTEECQQIFDTNRLQANAEPSCRANFVRRSNENRFNTRCFNAVTVVCDLNPFDSFCQYNTNYTNARPARIIACRDEVVNAPFCAEAKAFVCKDNPFDALCRLDYTMNTYATERNTAINDCQTTFVAGVVCVGAAVEFCTGKTATDVTDLFSSLCLTHSGTDTVRQPLCVGDKLPNTPISARCTETAMRICDATPLDPLCDGVEGYFSAQLDACVLNSNNPSCLVGSPTQFAALEPIAACLATPFDADCLNVATTQGMLFAPRAEAAQDAYCESGGARTTSTTVETTVDHVNCTNIGSLPVYADLARNITKNGIRTFNSDGSMVTANPVSGDNPNMGGFLRTGVFGTKLGDHAGTTSGTFTDENNNGNFDRGNDLGGAWLGLPTQPGSSLAPLGRGGDSDRIWDAASTTDPNDGFTYFIVDHDYEDVPGRDNDFFAYAGIWQTTNFGAPLAAPVGNAPTSAIWQGIFTPFSDKSIVETVASLTEIAQINREAINTRTTNFYVDFTNGTFNIHNPAGTDAQNPNGTDPTTGAVLGYIFGVGVGDEAVISKRIRYSVNGVFGAGIADLNNPGRMLNAGELGGNVTRSVEAATYAPDDTLTFGTDASPLVMPLTGLIGVEGALGIFVDPAVTTSPNVGGFTAAPTPAE